MPLKLAVGVKVTVPPLRPSVPFEAAATDRKVSVSPSASVSLARSDAVVMASGASSAVVPVSSVATGPSLTLVTVTATRPVSLAAPSVTVYSKLAAPW